MLYLGVIYCIENKLNDKKYIGKSIDVIRRWEEHKRNSFTAIEKAIDKHGNSNFNIFIVEENIKDDLLNIREKYWIKYYNTYKGKGYNCTPGGEGYSGKEHPLYGIKYSKSRLKRMSEKFSGENNPMYGKKHSRETRRKISESNKGKTLSLETREKMSESHKGFKHTEESKTKMSKNTSGKNHWAYGKQGKEIYNAKGNKKKSLNIIYDYFIKKYTQNELAKKYNYGQATISEIVNCRHWTTRDLER